MKLSFRIGVRRFEEEHDFDRLLTFLTRHKECVDEIALFTEYWHYGYYSVEEIEELSQILKDRINKLQKYGFQSVGINVENTLGHNNEAHDFLFDIPFQPLMGPAGENSQGSPCPNTEEYKEYIREKYQLMAKAKPDFIWVDDDVRMQSHGIKFSCFCPECISIFNKNNNSNFNRDSLVSRLNDKDGRELREKWIQQNIKTISELLAVIEKAVHEIAEEIELGFMTTGLNLSTYSGEAYKEWLKELDFTKVRPGGGFYNDKYPFGFVPKVYECERQVQLLPSDVTDIQYELENFPHQKLGKSCQIVLSECTAAIARNMNGIAYNIFTLEANSMDDYDLLLENINEYKNLWEKINKSSYNYQAAGFFPALSRFFDARRSVKDENWFNTLSSNNDIAQVYILSEIGIPLTMDQDNFCGVILSGNMAEGYTNKELKEFLSSGVFLDGKALEILWEKGLGKYCGVSINNKYDNGVLEQLSNHKINGKYVGEKRNARIDFFGGEGYILNPLKNNVEVVSNLISFVDDKLGPTLTLYENQLGGRIAVSGYATWEYLYSSAKRAQVISVLEWISRKNIPVLIEDSLKVVPFIKMSSDNKKFLIMLLNASFDETGEFEMTVRSSAKKPFLLTKHGETKDASYKIDNNKLKMKINNIKPWDFQIIQS